MITFILYTVLFLLGLALYFNQKKPKNFPPGPPRLPFIGSLLSVGIPPQKGLSRLTKKYGKLFSIYCGNYPAIVINDLQMIRDAFNDDRFTARPPLRPFIERSLGFKGLIFGSGSQWYEQRKFIMKVFRDFGFGRRDTQEIILKEVEELKSALRELIGKPTPVNAHFHTAIVNTLWTIVAGKRFEYDDPEFHNLIKLTSSIVRFRSLDSSSVMPHILFFQPTLTKLFPSLTGWNEMKEGFDATTPLLKKYVEDHKASFDSNHIRDLIDVYLQKIETMDDKNSSFYKETGERSLLIVLLDLFVAGGETASSNITWAILYLISHPNIQQKVHEEIARVVGMNRKPSLSDRIRMPYLEAVVNETLRMATIGALSIMHSASELIPNFHGYTLPKDTIVYGNFWHVHHDPEVWGDPQNFRPERFMDGNSTKYALINVFSRGKRVCPGESLARDEIFLFLAGVLQEFKFRRDPSIEPPCLDPTLAATLRIHTYNVIIEARN